MLYMWRKASSVLQKEYKKYSIYNFLQISDSFFILLVGLKDKRMLEFAN